MPNLPQFGQYESFKTATIEIIAIIVTLIRKNIDSLKFTHPIPKTAVNIYKKYVNVILDVFFKNSTSVTIYFKGDPLYN